MEIERREGRGRGLTQGLRLKARGPRGGQGACSTVRDGATFKYSRSSERIEMVLRQADNGRARTLHWLGEARQFVAFASSIQPMS